MRDDIWKFLVKTKNLGKSLKCKNICLFHLLVQKYFDRVQYFLNMNKFFWPWSKVIFYLIDLHIWAWSKIFDHIQKILNVVKKFFELADGIGIQVQIIHYGVQIGVCNGVHNGFCNRVRNGVYNELYRWVLHLGIL